MVTRTLYRPIRSFLCPQTMHHAPLGDLVLEDITAFTVLALCYYVAWFNCTGNFVCATPFCLLLLVSMHVVFLSLSCECNLKMVYLYNVA
ncbi:hypothetical protein BDZ91DRAFT_679882 [Kalaharituber pfeilii]|nr:hypothetical protein BDZ91DRAFT_679882 [Kalaharituber pfeilii]